MWDEIVPQLSAAGLVSPADGPSIETMLRHLHLIRLAHREVMELGTVVVPASQEGVEKKHPAEAILRLESTHFMEYAKQLGMTWMSRARTAATATGGADGANPFEGSEATG
jgi:phage terminase small subunit